MKEQKIVSGSFLRQGGIGDHWELGAMRILQQALGKQGGADAGKSIAIEIMEGISSAMKLSGFRIICRVLLKKKSGLYRNDNTLWGPDLLFARKRFERCWNIGFSKRKSMSTVT